MEIIANPQAARGRGQGDISKLKSLLDGLGVVHQIHTTTCPGDATAIARDLVQRGLSRIVVMGGDGTFAEVINGVAGSPVEVGLIPRGTGNDLARSLGLPFRDLRASVEVVLRGRPKCCDLGRVGDRFFISVLGVGFPALVAEETNRNHWIKGSPAFFLSVYKALTRMKPVRVKVVLEGETLERDVTSILVHNTPFTGGGLKMAPDAKMDDGLLDVVVIDKIGKLDLMVNFPKVYQGKHLGHPRFSVRRTRSVRIESEIPLPTMCDGDLVGETPVSAEVVPAVVSFLVPLQ